MEKKQINAGLIYKGFTEKKLDTGFNYTKTVNRNVELICYIEPDISVSFITIYKWDNNEIKGHYDLTAKEMEGMAPDLDTLFKKAVKDMPKFLGDKDSGVNIHSTLEAAIDEVFIHNDVF